MVQLKRSPINFTVSGEVTLVHHISQQNSFLHYIEAQVFEMQPKGTYQLELVDRELCIVALTGKYTISDGTETFKGVGTRKNVFEKIPTDSVYIANGKTAEILCEEAGKVILCLAPTTAADYQTTLIKAEDNLVEHRGIKHNQRLVHNILDDQSPLAEKLLVVEVFTDAANWSSYPPHKHDVDDLPTESFLEETYYHEIDPQQGFVFQRVYSDDRLLDESMAVDHQDMVLVPVGYHPVAVAEGYNSYYLNIMAGPTKAWKFHNDTDHEWIIDRKEQTE